MGGGAAVVVVGAMDTFSAPSGALATGTGTGWGRNCGGGGSDGTHGQAAVPQTRNF